jgi:hypothetical protein
VVALQASGIPASAAEHAFAARIPVTGACATGVRRVHDARIPGRVAYSVPVR